MHDFYNNTIPSGFCAEKQTPTSNPNSRYLNSAADLYAMNKEELLKKAYRLFNARQADELLQLMTPDVHWPNGWEGGYVNGRDAVKEYWTRQWAEVIPEVLPQSFVTLNDDKVEVVVAQTVKDKQGNVLINNEVKHIYTFTGERVSEMQIAAVE